MAIPTWITQDNFEAFLKCPKKSHLVSEGAVGIESEFHDWQRRLQEDYKEAASARLRLSRQANESYIGTLPAEKLKERQYRLIFDYVVAEPDVHARLHALELERSTARARHCFYTPIRFVPREKLAASDRLLLAFDAFAFSRATGKLPTVGEIVHGRRHSVIKVSLNKLLGKVRLLVQRLATERDRSAPPPVLNSPWNNNNAEHAIKALVKLRRSIGGQSSPRGMRDYLVLLSISQTCRYRGVSFLDFLRSGQIDVSEFSHDSPRKS